MNLTNKTRSYIWLCFAILSLICVISRIVDVAMGDKEWWHLVTTIIMTSFCIRFYICYRQKAQADR